MVGVDFWEGGCICMFVYPRMKGNEMDLGFLPFGWGVV